MITYGSFLPSNMITRGLIQIRLQSSRKTQTEVRPICPIWPPRTFSTIIELNGEIGSHLDATIASERAWMIWIHGRHSAPAKEIHRRWNLPTRTGRLFDTFEIEDLDQDHARVWSCVFTEKLSLTASLTEIYPSHFHATGAGRPRRLAQVEETTRTRISQPTQCDSFRRFQGDLR